MFRCRLGRSVYVSGGWRQSLSLSAFYKQFHYPYLGGSLFHCSSPLLSNLSFLCSWGNVGWDKEKGKEMIGVRVMRMLVA